MRICVVCEEEKPTTEFYENRRSRGGYYTYCKPCGRIKRRTQNKVCRAPFCPNKSDGGKFCTTHRKWLKSGKDLNIVAKYYAPETDYRGPEPKVGEKAIYVLRGEDSIVFYVGSSDTPRTRLRNHRLSFGNQIQMIVLRCVPYTEVVYWESKTLVEYIDAGHPIINCEAPVTRSKNGMKEEI